MLECTSDSDFLAKVHCVRLAFDDIISSKQNRDYFKITARELVSAFLTSTNQVGHLTTVYVLLKVSPLSPPLCMDTWT